MTTDKKQKGRCMFQPYDETVHIEGCRSMTKDERVELMKSFGIEWNPPEDFGKPGWFERAEERERKSRPLGVRIWCRIKKWLAFE